MAFLRLCARSRPRRGEEFRQLAVSKGEAKYPEGAWRIAEPVGDHSGWQPVVEIGAQSLVLALLRGGRFGEEAAAFR
jgi:hypothetical protein